MKTMTPRQRWLAALRMEPVDRLPFWPKLDAAYPRAQTGESASMPVDDVHRFVGSDRHVWLPSCLRFRRTRSRDDTSEAEGARTRVFGYGSAELRRVDRFDVESQSFHPVAFPIRNREDLRHMRKWFDDCEVELDQDALAEARRIRDAEGEDAVTATSIGESPLMDLVEWLASVENAHALLHEFPDEVESLFAAMHRVLLDTAGLCARNHPADLLYMVENTSTTLISPDQYERYCAPRIDEYGRVVDESGGLLVLHMCGHLKALLGRLSGIRARAFEAFTSPPVGNTTLLDGRSMCPDKCLVGGTNAMLWVGDGAEIIEEIRRDLDVLPHHRGLVITSAGVMPPRCRPETIREVAEALRSYAVRT